MTHTWVLFLTHVSETAFRIQPLSITHFLFTNGHTQEAPAHTIIQQRKQYLMMWSHFSNRLLKTNYSIYYFCMTSSHELHDVHHKKAPTVETMLLPWIFNLYGNELKSLLYVCTFRSGFHLEVKWKGNLAKNAYFVNHSFA